MSEEVRTDVPRSTQVAGTLILCVLFCIVLIGVAHFFLDFESDYEKCIGTMPLAECIKQL